MPLRTGPPGAPSTLCLFPAEAHGLSGPFPRSAAETSTHTSLCFAWASGYGQDSWAAWEHTCGHVTGRRPASDTVPSDVPAREGGREPRVPGALPSTVSWVVPGNSVPVTGPCPPWKGRGSGAGFVSQRCGGCWRPPSTRRRKGSPRNPSPLQEPCVCAGSLEKSCLAWDREPNRLPAAAARAWETAAVPTPPQSPAPPAAAILGLHLLLLSSSPTRLKSHLPMPLFPRPPAFCASPPVISTGPGGEGRKLGANSLAEGEATNSACGVHFYKSICK